jgi:DNA integrity scanning protein DisA with diadenylate cyclase activity
MKMEDFLKPLELIKQVEVPSFLFTRIKQKIQNELNGRISMKTAYSMLACFFILLSINVFVVVSNNKTKSAATNIGESFQLLPNNNLYK